jgi:serine/threonine protein kinase
MSVSMIDSSLHSVALSLKDFPKKAEDYKEFMNYYKLSYTQVDHHYQVGQINHVQGWVLHLSAVISEVADLFEKVVPLLVKENIPFKIPVHKNVTINILMGYMGAPQVGKIMTIYPESSDRALELAKKLTLFTKEFKGPAIPTDICLGGIVYTRYGSCNPIIKIGPQGRKVKYIYNRDGELIKDLYAVPFKLPDGVSWPFAELASPNPITRKKILNHFYKPQYRIKSDARGNVYKGIYVKGIFHAAPCVIKQGKKHMGSEESGRDVRSKLQWQQYLYQQLGSILPLPRIIDLFEDEGDTYLVMELIKGNTLHDQTREINYNLRAWRDLNIRERKLLVDYLIQILSTIKRMHQHGYVHRDIQPSNFLIDSRGKIFLIDIELAWSVIEEIPDPPFELGTPGFMSPEQCAVEKPTFKEDVYGFGGLMISIFTGLSPVKFATPPENLVENLTPFIGNKSLAGIISSSRMEDPKRRPNLTAIESAILEYNKELRSQDAVVPVDNSIPSPDPKSIQKTILEGLAGLNKSPILTFNNLWYSKDTRTENIDTPSQKEFTCLPGMREGIGGVLYLLARARWMGYTIEHSLTGYYSGYELLATDFITNLGERPPGLYNGCAGVAMTLAEGIKAGLLENDENNRCLIERCLNSASAGVNVASGAAGQGIAVLACTSYLNPAIRQKLLNQLLSRILDTQLKDGSWIVDEEMTLKGNAKSIGWGFGTSGILGFLLKYLSSLKDADVQRAANRGLKWLRSRTKDLNSLFDKTAFEKLVPLGVPGGDERLGILRTFIKAYEVFKEAEYRIMVEKALFKYPLFVVTNNFTQESGLAGLGELYLDAIQLFSAEPYLSRINWIVQVFAHTAIRSQEQSCYWQIEEYQAPTADLAIGNSGILHFLIRSMNTDKLGHCMSD